MSNLLMVTVCLAGVPCVQRAHANPAAGLPAAGQADRPCSPCKGVHLCSPSCECMLHSRARAHALHPLQEQGKRASACKGSSSSCSWRWQALLLTCLAAVQVTFEQDVMLSPANEYEVLQLLLGECKTRLGNYAGGLEPCTQDCRCTISAAA